MRIPLVVSLAPLALALACTDEGPIQSVGPKLTISPATVSVETGADPVPLQAVPENGDLTGNVTWDLLSGNAGTLGASTGQTVTFTPTDLGTPGGNVLVRATGTVGGTTQPATAAVQVVASSHGRIVLVVGQLELFEHVVAQVQRFGCRFQPACVGGQARHIEQPGDRSRRQDQTIPGQVVRPLLRVGERQAATVEVDGVHSAANRTHTVKRVGEWDRDKTGVDHATCHIRQQRRVQHVVNRRDDRDVGRPVVLT